MALNNMFYHCKINKIFLVSWFAILTISASQNLYAHNENPGIEKRTAEREVAKEQEDRETWDDFMKAVKAQETEANADEAPDHSKPHSQ
jgi:Holliday junction resolvasome RuvABC DNA-binding subunit